MKFPMAFDTITAAEKEAAISVIKSGMLTMGPKTKEMEEAFAKYVGAKYCIMVNSGSSANLLALAATKSSYFPKERRLENGDEVLVPAVAWATSVAPIIQLGLKPVFVDVDHRTLNIDLASARSKLTDKTKALLAVHILGNSASMDSVMEFVSDNKLLLIEDTCESMGSSFNNKKLGTFGAMGTFSSYFSHHITTGEGGYVVTNHHQIYSLLLMLRSHGWVRDLRQDLKEMYTRYAPDVDPRFLFLEAGFNLRPTDINAAIGVVQLKKIEEMNAARVYNREALIEALTSDNRFKGQLTFPLASRGVTAAWFGFPFMTDYDRKKYSDYLLKNGMDNRPIVSGNFLRQPMLQETTFVFPPADTLPGAERVHSAGLYIGLPPHKLPAYAIHEYVDVLLGYTE
jgi:CDP-6-deoxy-D-xylo-4-hexulose-3-dehydrase